MSRLIAEIKTLKEIFPEIDLREFQTMRALCEDSYKIEITVNDIKYSSSLENQTVLILNTSEPIKDDSVYSCSLINSNGVKMGVTLSVYGKWMKNIRSEDTIPYEREFIDIMSKTEKMKTMFDNLYTEKREFYTDEKIWKPYES